MADITVKFRASSVEGRDGSIYFQVIHARKVRQLSAGYGASPSDWEACRGAAVSTSAAIVGLRRRIGLDLERFGRIVRHLDSSGYPYTAEDVCIAYRRYMSECSVVNFMRSIIAQLKDNGKIRTAETYRLALNSLRRFTGSDDLMLDCLTADFMERYEAWHIKRGNTQNTISFYNRIIRAVYNRAVELRLIENRNPFRRVSTGVYKTVKRALSLDTIRRIKALDLSQTPTLDYARNIFILSFMLRGMSFVDMAFLRKSDLRGGYIEYRRRKTGQLLTIEWTREMEGVLSKYPCNRSDYLLPIIRQPGVNPRSVYRNMGYNINRSLKTIGNMVGLSAPLTLYVARHSWASAAKSKGIPLSVISQGMGHDRESTTQIYLSSLSSAVVDRANSLIISSI